MTDTRVARLRLTAPDEAHVRRGALLVEDAMRIATLAADSDRRVYIVRHLDVGVIDPEAPPHTLALQIERRMAHVQMTAVPATSAESATARAVWFADETAAVAELGRRLARGTPTEWFWRHVAGGAVKAPSSAAALRACLSYALALPTAPLAVATLINAVEDVRDGALLELVHATDGEPLFRALFGAVPSAGMPTALPDVLATLAPAWRARLVRWVAHWGADVRSLWLAAVAAIASRGAQTAVMTEVARARQLVTAVLVRAASTAPEQPPAALAAPSATPPTPAPSRSAPGSDEPRDERHDTAAPGESAVVLEAPVVVETTIDSAAAGALFLIRPLAMLGIADWLADHPWTANVSWPAQLLAAIVAEHAGPDDPLARALADEPLRDGPFVAPARWRALVGQRPHRLRPAGDRRVLEAFGRLPLACWGDEPVDVDTWRSHTVRRGPPAADRTWAATAWQRALTRWLRTFAGVRLADVVCRRAMLVSTPSHIDLVMPLRSVDPRIRAAGLDLDPGWVPWLGRIVKFHYRQEAR